MEQSSKIIIGVLSILLIIISVSYGLNINNICGKGRKLYKCPNSDVSICIKPGQNYSTMCKSGSITKTDSDSSSSTNCDENLGFFSHLGGVINYNGENLKIIQSLIFQFSGSPQKSLIFTGYSNKHNNYVQVLMTDSIKPYPPIYGAVYVTDSPWTPSSQEKSEWTAPLTSTSDVDTHYWSFSDITFGKSYITTKGTDNLTFTLSSTNNNNL